MYSGRLGSAVFITRYSFLFLVRFLKLTQAERPARHFDLIFLFCQLPILKSYDITYLILSTILLSPDNVDNYS